MPAQRRRRWADIVSTLGERLVGICQSLRDVVGNLYIKLNGYFFAHSKINYDQQRNIE